MDYKLFYDMVEAEERRLKEQRFSLDDYRNIEALAACYRLREYLAAKIADEVSQGKQDDDC